MKKSLLLIALLAGAAHAEPTKEETWDYIYKNLIFSRDDYSFSYSFNKSTCTLQSGYRGVNQEDGSLFVTNTETVNLADLDPNEIQTDEIRVAIDCRERKECVHYVVKSKYFRGENRYFSKFNILTVLPKRVAKAFAHLIRLCGGKPELF